uniref:non-specific protein-tyrosine kinase n=1 Tax=Loa loa TaxID=7209 RepID=A0A1I7VZ39_LOALO
MTAEQCTISELLYEADLLCYEHSMRTVLRLRSAADMSYVDEKDLNKIGMTRPEQKRLQATYYRKFDKSSIMGKLRRKILGKGNLKKKEQHSPSYHEQHVIPLENITLSKQLGKGEFGSVYQAAWSNSNNTEQIQVAVKCILPEKLFANPLNFLQEVAVLHKMRHECVVRLYGVVLDTKAVMLVSELAPCGSLLECLQKPSLRATFFVDTFCKFSIQIAQGMKYLSSERLIHRDLAARNVLVFSAERVKISDFGLSRSLGMGEDYYRSEFSEAVKLPIAWCAPEAINFLKFTSASDVWSYGVTLFEIFSFGQMPWAGLTGAQILAAIDYPNLQRLECPDACPIEFYNLMMQCWAHKPEERPSFADIVRQLPEIMPQCLVTVTSCCDGIIDHLQYSKNETIVVLDRCPPTYPDGYFWRGYMRNGRTGLFRPEATVARLAIEMPNSKCSQYLSSVSFLPHSKISPHEKEKTQDKSSRKKLLISEPQGDVHHTCHVGVDGTTFGLLQFGKNDISVKSSTAAH